LVFGKSEVASVELFLLALFKLWATNHSPLG